MTFDLGYVKLTDRTRWTLIDRWLERQGERYEGCRVLPQPTAAERVRARYAAARDQVREATNG